MARTVRDRRREHLAAARAPRSRDRLDHCSGCREAGLDRGWPTLGGMWLRCSKSDLICPAQAVGPVVHCDIVCARDTAIRRLHTASRSVTQLLVARPPME